MEKRALATNQLIIMISIVLFFIILLVVISQKFNVFNSLIN